MGIRPDSYGGPQGKTGDNAPQSLRALVCLLARSTAREHFQQTFNEGDDHETIDDDA